MSEKSKFERLMDRNDAEITARKEWHDPVGLLCTRAMNLMCDALPPGSPDDTWAGRVEAWVNDYERERTKGEPQLADPRCPHCKRPVILGWSKAIKGEEGSYHERCVQPPDEAEVRVGPIRSRESNSTRKEE